MSKCFEQSPKRGERGSKKEFPQVVLAQKSDFLRRSPYGMHWVFNKGGIYLRFWVFNMQ